MKLTELLRTSQGSRSVTLDGVRGFSVVVLMLYHFGVNALQGAWVGISLFFVFSGYVIVMIMLKENASTSRIDYVEFYRRRARRLLPALFTMIVVIGGWALLVGDNVVRRPMRGDILATFGFVMNWRLISQADQYFAEFANPSYFRHVWTLSVEEQFYLVAPFLVAFLIRNVATRRIRVGIVLALVLASGVTAAVVGVATTGAQAHVYYGTDTRVQSLLAGMAVAFAVGPDRTGARPPAMAPRVAAFWAWTATAVTVTAFFTVEPMAAYMFDWGGMTVLSLLTAIGLVGAVQVGPGLFRRIFTNTVLVYLGILTYGLYLWHWPVKLWMDRYLPEMSMPVTLLIGSLATFAAAAASFHVLELPVMLGGLRRLTGRVRRGRVLLVGSIVAVLGLAVLVGRVPTVQQDIDAGRVPQLVEDTDPYEPGTPPVAVAIFGDSVPYYLAERFPEQVYSDLRLTNLAVPGCGLLPLATYWAPEYQEPVGQACTDGRARLAADLQSSRADTLVLMVGSDLAIPHQRADGSLVQIGDEEYRRMVEAELDRLAADARGAGVSVLQLATLPCREMSMKGLGELPFDTDWYEDNPQIARNLTDPVVINEWFAQWAERHDVVLVDLYGALGCHQGFAKELHGIRLFRDAMHFSEEATPMIWTWLAPTIRQNFHQSTQ